jgi:hypothetical protein
MKVEFSRCLVPRLQALAFVGMLVLVSNTASADPQIDSWLTAYSSQYARIYTSDGAKAAGRSVTTWSNGRLAQSLPAYCGVQEILTSSNWVYVLTTGLASYTMGPWYIDLSRTRPFPNMPVNQKLIYRIPRTPSAASRSPKRLGEIGFFVDGVRMFDATDAFSYSTSNCRDANPMAGIGQGDHIWNRDAWVNERFTFDSGYAHQQDTGRFHYHANPIALRCLLRDHVDYDSVAGKYYESAGAPAQHSPIIGWMQDGFPLYGPYGYSNPTSANSTVRRMISGYGPRDGSKRTDNLSTSGRVALPAWTGRILHRSTALPAGQYGPRVSATYPIGHYLEDYAYLGDCGGKPGADFDLDECNGRWCVTPEFPNGTYAYFSTINADGSPAYPYNMGRKYHGNPSGGLVSSITEPVLTNFVGGADAPLKITGSEKANNTLTLAWSAVEGGTYLIESTIDNSSWITNAVGIASARNHGRYTLSNSETERIFDVKRTALARYDSVKRVGNGVLSIVPSSGARGSVVDVTVNLDWALDPPPVFAPINLVGIGSLAGRDTVHVNRARVTSRIAIPASAPVGAQTVSVVFPGPPDDPSRTVTYTLINGFTIN